MWVSGCGSGRGSWREEEMRVGVGVDVHVIFLPILHPLALTPTLYPLY